MKKVSFFLAACVFLASLKGDIHNFYNQHRSDMADQLSEIEILTPALELIKEHEGQALKAYVCPGGRKTIGYGHVIKKKQKLSAISRAQAEELLLSDMKLAKEMIDRLVTVKLTPNQLSALISFVFNVGSHNFAQSKMLALINQEKHEDVPAEFSKWIFAKRKKLKGLELRRKKEAMLYANMSFENHVTV